MLGLAATRPPRCPSPARTPGACRMAASQSAARAARARQEPRSSAAPAGPFRAPAPPARMLRVLSGSPGPVWQRSDGGAPVSVDDSALFARLDDVRERCLKIRPVAKDVHLLAMIETPAKLSEHPAEPRRAAHQCRAEIARRWNKSVNRAAELSGQGLHSLSTVGRWRKHGLQYLQGRDTTGLASNSHSMSGFVRFRGRDHAMLHTESGRLKLTFANNREIIV